MSSKVFLFSELDQADLVIDAVYEGGTSGHIGDDPISKLMRCGNQGGFRYTGTVEKAKFCVLYSELTHSDWPDELNAEHGQFIYFGDNRQPGSQLLNTKKNGNLMLKNTFDCLHSGRRAEIPPFFIFTKLENSGRSVVFRGLAVPGSLNLTQSEDLIAIWKSIKGERFQNYKAIFTILNVPIIKREWLRDLDLSTKLTDNSPTCFKKWINEGNYDALIAPPSVGYRTVRQQQPQNQEELFCINAIKEYFEMHVQGAYAFEKCASAIAQLMDANIISCDNTRHWRDGGRDATGVYRIGFRSAYTDVDFSLEAKCYKIEIGCGVKETSRLIARLRHRQFGIFVTTSYVSLQAYKEILEDKHPVLILAATDIAKILISKGLAEPTSLINWLKQF